MSGRPSRTWLKAIVPVLVIAAAVAGAVLLKATRPEVAARAAEERLWPVATIPVAIADQRPRISLDGEVVAGREGDLRPLVSGIIVEVRDGFRAGGPAAADELLVRIDPFPYRAAVDERGADLAEGRARLAELRAEVNSERRQLERDREQLTLARQDLRRRRELRQAGTVSERALDEAEIIASEREQRVLAREQTIARLGARIDQAAAAIDRAASALSRAERDLENTVLRAPFAGLLSETEAAAGKQVSTNDRLARLIDLASLEARFHIPDAVYARLLAGGPIDGRPATVRWRIGERVLAFDAVLDRVESRIAAASGGVQAFARMPGLDLDTPLRPGAFVTVELSDRIYENAARLPQRAVHDGVVYAVRDGRLEARQVETLARDGADILVKGELADGERVVVTRFPELAPGLKVSPR